MSNHIEILTYWYFLPVYVTSFQVSQMKNSDKNILHHIYIFIYFSYSLDEFIKERVALTERYSRLYLVTFCNNIYILVFYVRHE